MSKTDQKDFSSLAVVSCYFNPSHYQNRRSNYDIFAAGIRKTGVKFLTVELAFGEDPFELPASDEVIQIRTPHVMWQKERLLNIGIKSLPAYIDKVAWFDCDILFASEDWPARLSALLDKCVFVQCWKDFVFLPRGQTMPLLTGPKKFGAAFYYLECGRMERGHTGFAWAARRELLDKYALYDANILGAGDLSMAFALYGSENSLCWAKDLSVYEWFTKMNPEMTAHLENWITPFAGQILNKIGYLDETVYTLYHGELTDRFYGERTKILRVFNPFKDITIGPNQCWYWNTNKYDFHRDVREYFNLRSEDSKLQNA